MKRMAATAASWVTVAIVRFLAWTCPDCLFRLASKGVERLSKDPFAQQVAQEVHTIFSSKVSSRQARGILRHSRPEQLRSFIRGALR